MPPCSEKDMERSNRITLPRCPVYTFPPKALDKNLTLTTRKLEITVSNHPKFTLCESTPSPCPVITGDTNLERESGGRQSLDLSVWNPHTGFLRHHTPVRLPSPRDGYGASQATSSGEPSSPAQLRLLSQRHRSAPAAISPPTWQKVCYEHSNNFTIFP